MVIDLQDQFTCDKPQWVIGSRGLAVIMAPYNKLNVNSAFLILLLHLSHLTPSKQATDLPCEDCKWSEPGSKPVTGFPLLLFNCWLWSCIKAGSRPNREIPWLLLISVAQQLYWLNSPIYSFYGEAHHSILFLPWLRHFDILCKMRTSNHNITIDIYKVKWDSSHNSNNESGRHDLRCWNT